MVMPFAGESVLSEPLPIAESHADEIEGVVREHSRIVYRIAWAVLRNHHDAEDAVQETFLRFLRHRQSWPAIRDKRAWLAQAAWHVAIDFHRKGRGQRPEVGLNEAVAAVSRLRAAGASADDIASRHEMNDLLHRLIQGLPGDLRDTLQLSLAEELTSAEIGALLGIPEGSVRQRLWKARQILRARLSAVLEGNHAR